MKCFIIIITVSIITCFQQGSPEFEVILNKFIFNKIPLPNESIINNKVVKRDFILKKSETFAVKDFNIEKIKKGIIDTTFQYYPISIKVGEVTLNNSRFQIGLIDENRNERYNELGIDKLIFLPKSTDSIYYYPLIYAPVITQRAGMVCQINGSNYNVNVENEKIKLRLVTPNTREVDCIFNSSIPDLIVQNEDGKDINLRLLKEPNKNLIVELWFDGCRGCIKTLPYLKEIDFEENTLISLNVTDGIDIINDFKVAHGLPWDMIKAEKDALIQLGNLGNYPSAIVYDKNGELVDFSKKYN